MNEDQLYEELQKAVRFDTRGKEPVPDILLLEIDDSEIAYVVRKCAKHIIENYGELIDQSATIARQATEIMRLMRNNAKD